MEVLKKEFDKKEKMVLDLKNQNRGLIGKF